jgi:hypothetical protein
MLSAVPLAGHVKKITLRLPRCNGLEILAGKGKFFFSQGGSFIVGPAMRMLEAGHAA